MAIDSTFVLIERLKSAAMVNAGLTALKKPPVAS
jgi:hypothetical protein